MANLVTYGYGLSSSTIVVNITAESILAGQLFIGNTLVPISSLDNRFREKRGAHFDDECRGTIFKEKRGNCFGSN